MVAYGDHICGEQGEESEGDDDVNGGVEVEIYKTDDAGADGGEVDGVVGNVTFIIHLKPTVSPLSPAPAIADSRGRST